MRVDLEALDYGDERIAALGVVVRRVFPGHPDPRNYAFGYARSRVWGASPSVAHDSGYGFVERHGGRVRHMTRPQRIAINSAYALLFL